MLIETGRNRRVIPRWRSVHTTRKIGELSSLRLASGRIKANHVEELKRLGSRWQLQRTIENAGEFIGLAELLGKKDRLSIEAAEQVASNGDSAHGLRLFANSFLSESPCPTIGINTPLNDRTETIRKQIQTLKTSLINYVRNPVGWVELARLYQMIGQSDQASRSIRIALNLAGDNRFVVRSAARFLIHVEEEDKAHHILLRSEATKYDPWLLSAEIAAASVAGRTTRNAKKARQLIENSNFTLFSKSELACALATLEMSNGANRQAKKLFEYSLIEPTDNSVAQVTWASKSLTSLALEDSHLSIPLTFEAAALNSRKNGDWNNVVSNCQQWHLDESFSTRPCVLGSFIASEILRDFELCEEFSRAGLRSNPNDPILLNNLAVALIYQGKLDKASRIIDRIHDIPQKADASVSTYLPTKGLLNFRKGEFEAGRQQYFEFIDNVSGPLKEYYQALALLHLAQEELRVGSANFENVVDRTREIKKKLNFAELNTIFDTFSSIYDSLIRDQAVGYRKQTANSKAY